jgi:hypothetical protein
VDGSPVSANTSPESEELPWEFGRTARHAARGALVLCVLGSAAVWGLHRLLTRPDTPAGGLFRATGVPEWLLLYGGLACVAGCALYGYARSVRNAPRFRLTAEGLTVTSTLGTYTLQRDNLRRVGVTPSGALGISVRDRAQVLATHRGTEQQREWLRTAAPYGEWDFLFDRAELGVPAETVARRLS